MKEVTRLDVFSLGKVQAIVMAFFGLIVGLIYGTFAAFFLSVSGHPAWAFGGFFGALIFIPLIYAVMGLVMGLICGLLYNLVAKWVGGIKFELVDRKK